MAPTICSAKKFKTRILGNDVKRRKRDNFNNNAATVYDIPRQYSSQMDENILNNIINNSLPLNLTCNKLRKISDKCTATASTCDEKNLFIKNDMENRRKLMQADNIKHKHINYNSKISESEVPITMNVIPLSLTSLSSALQISNRNRRCSASSMSSMNDDTSNDGDYSNNDDESIDDDYNDTATVIDDYQFYIQSIDDKKRRFYNAIISGKFNESECENDADHVNSNYSESDDTFCSNRVTNEMKNHDDQIQNITTYEKDKSSMLITTNDAKKIPSTLLPSLSLALPLADCIHNTDDLLGIAIKTIKLVQRNQLLQQRLNQLQLETSAFIESVLNNPENRHFREKVLQKMNKITNI